ncbi:MAG TPA: FAD-dependent oxidoreductase [Candidatus Binatia bacterium]
MESQSSDILIIGAGLAGFTAAVRASEQGAKVLLIDKSDGELGDGNVLMASGSLRAGGKSPKTDAEELYQFVMAEGVGNLDLVRAWSLTCGRAIAWLISSGVRLEESSPGRVWLDQESEICLGPVYKKDVGPRALAKLKQRFLDLGGRFMNRLEGCQLIVENQQVVGLLAKQNGIMIELRGKATILSTGGFSANPELIKKYIGPRADQCKLRGSKQDTGDGLRMALEAGAKAVNLQYFYGHLIARKALSDDRFWPYPRLDSFVDEGILVDRRGERFVDEGRGDVAVANELARSEDPTGATLIFDDESWRASKDSPSSTSLKIPAPNPWMVDNGAELFSHSTIEGLANALEIGGATLKNTLENYHRAIESSDAKSLTVPRTGKPKQLRAPFYGLRVVSGITFTMGGVAINGRAEVIDDHDQPIPGLYAAGDAIGGLMGGFRGGYTGGLMQAVVTGILAGEHAASTK